MFYGASAVALPVVAWSEVVTLQTGEGLQGAFLGGLEGVSYLVLLGLVGKSIALKVRTGTVSFFLLPPFFSYRWYCIP